MMTATPANACTPSFPCHNLMHNGGLLAGAPSHIPVVMVREVGTGASRQRRGVVGLGKRAEHVYGALGGRATLAVELWYVEAPGADPVKGCQARALN
eukprot:4954435-Alexandrium_andersonii.AAC.1